MRVPKTARDIATRTFAALSLAGIAASGVAAQAHADQPITVYMDHARILKLNHPISKVIVGNANIADVAVADAETIVLTGKAYGTTNLVILGKDGSAIVDKDVLVSTDEDHTVRVYRQTKRTVLSCGPNCEVNADGRAVVSLIPPRPCDRPARPDPPAPCGAGDGRRIKFG